MAVADFRLATHFAIEYILEPRRHFGTRIGGRKLLLGLADIVSDARNSQRKLSNSLEERRAGVVEPSFLEASKGFRTTLVKTTREGQESNRSVSFGSGRDKLLGEDVHIVKIAKTILE